MAQPDTPSQLPSDPERGSASVLRRVFGVLGLALCAVFMLWLVTPWLAAPVARHYLPDGWALETLELDRPGLKRTSLATGRLTGRLAGLDITVELEGLDWRYAGPVLHVETVRITAVPETTDRPAPAFRPGDLGLPRLVLPSVEAVLEIELLVLQYGSGEAAVSGSLKQLRLDGGAESLRLVAELAPNAIVNDASRLSLDWGAQLFRLDWHVASQPRSPGLRIEQSARTEPDPVVDGLVQADLDLAVLDAATLTPLAEAIGLPPLEAATGRLRANLALEGTQTLSPVRGDVALENVQLSTPETQLAMELDASATMARESPVLRVDRLRLETEGPLPRINEALADALRSLPVEGFDPGAPFSFELSAPLDPETAVELRFTASGDAPTLLTGSLALEAQLDGETRVAARLPALRWIRDGDEGSFSADALELRLRRGRTLVYRLEEGALGFSAAQLHLVGDLAQTDSDLDFSGELAVGEFSDFSLSQPALTARFRTFGLAGPLRVGSNVLRFEGALGGAGLVVAPADAVAASSLMTAESVAFDLLAEGLEATDISGKGRFNGVALPDLGARASGVDLELGSLRLPSVDGRLAGLTTGLEIRLEGTEYKGLDLEVRGDLRAGRFLEGDGSLLLGFTGELPFRYATDLQLPTLEATLADARLGAGALPDAARALALTLPEALAFEGGELVLDGRIAYKDEALTGALDVRGDGLALALGESQFEGLDFTTRVDVADVISGRGPLALELANLAAGLELTAMSTSIEFAGADFGLLTFDARLLGGTLRTPSLKLVGGQLQGTLIEWTGFDLGQLLTFVDVSGLDGSGTLDATIPIVNDGSGPAVEAGRFAARGPGVLRYQSGVPATNIGLQALENFQYDSLEGQLDYASDGVYTITLDLLGRNPDLYGGHPVRFRLNLGGEMPALFRSLFITGDFEKAIIERLRAGEPVLPGGMNPPPETDP